MHPPRPLTAFFTCPQCQKVESSTCKVFQYSDIDRMHKCARCNKTSRIKSWKCSCGIEWQRCAVHRYSTLLEKTPIVSQSAQGQSHSELVTSKRKRKATSSLVTLDEIPADDIRVDNQKLDQIGRDHEPSDILLGVRKHKSVRINFLGPILKKRFYGDRCIS